MATSKKAPGKDSSLESSNFSDPNLLIENSLIQAKRYLIPVGSVILVLLIAMIIGAFLVNKKKDGVANAYAALHEALSKEGTDNEGDTAKIQEEKRNALQLVVESHSSTPAAIDAKFQLAKLEYDQGNYREAAKKFAEFHQEYPNQGTLSELAQMSEASCYFSLEKFDQAKEKYNSISSEKTTQGSKQFSTQVNYQIALCDLLLGNYDQAKSKLSSLLTSTEDEKSKEKAQSLLAKLDIILPEDLRNAILDNKDSSKPIELELGEFGNESLNIEPVSLQATPSSKVDGSSDGVDKVKADETLQGDSPSLGEEDSQNEVPQQKLPIPGEQKTEIDLSVPGQNEIESDGSSNESLEKDSTK